MNNFDNNQKELRIQRIHEKIKNHERILSGGGKICVCR
jgi:hypothetical protein